MSELPSAYRQFQQDYPGVEAAFEALGDVAHRSGPLDDRTRRLVKLAIAVGARLEGAVRSHARQARDAGISDAELDHVILLSLTTIGLPSAVAARTWIKDVLSAPA